MTAAGAESDVGAIPDRYRGAVATMWRNGRLEGHLHLEVQEWTSQPAPRVEDDRDDSVIGPPSRTRELIEWAVVWADASERPNPFTDGIVDDTRRLCAELDGGHFVLWGTVYDLIWLDEPEASRALAEVFGAGTDPADPVVARTERAGSAPVRSGWDLIVSMMLDNVRGTLRLLTITSVCLAVGTAAFGLARSEERGGAMAWALVLTVLAVVLASVWALVERWRRARRASRG